MSSSVYSISDSLYKKATRLYNDYIGHQSERIVQDMLQEISDGDLIFSKNNVCIHLNEPYHPNSSVATDTSCNKNCLPGYFSIKLIKCQPDDRSTDDREQLASVTRQKNKTQIEETSFIVRETFDLDELKSSKSNLNQRNDLDSHTPKNSSSVRLKQNESRTNSIKTSNYSMVITWISNLIFEEKPNKLTRNLSLKSNNPIRSHKSIRKRHKSFNDLIDRSTYKNHTLTVHSGQHHLSHNLNHKLCHNLINSRSSASDTQLDMVSKSFDLFSDDKQTGEESFIFTIDIKRVKSLKLFFGSHMNRCSDGDQNQHNRTRKEDGQLVIGNFDLQFKIFHFHSGLSKLEQFLDDWNFVFFKQKNFNNGFLSFFENLYEETNQFVDGDDSLLDFYMNKFVQLQNQKQLEEECNNNEISCIQLYTINLPALNYLDLQNEYSTYQRLSIRSGNDFNQYFSSDGVLIYDIEKLRVNCFFKGCDAKSRKYFWPYLLNRFSANLTNREKSEIKRHGEFLYRNIDEKRRNMKKDDKFYRKFIQYQSTIREDIPRTDRNNKALDKNKLEKMKNILLNYTLYSTRIGYTQGFSDLLAPLVIIFSNESESEIFWNFICLLEKNLVCLPNDDSIDSCMAKIRELLRVLDVKFYNYFKQLGEQSFQLLFTHRWMLLCFRREFEENSALRVWESCLSEFQCQFQLFICIAIIQIYGQDPIERQLNSDDVLFYFANLSLKMDADVVMNRARSNLFQFRTLISFNKVPCTLRSLCNYKSKPNHPSDWSTQLQPFFECVRSVDPSNADAILLCTCSLK